METYPRYVDYRSSNKLPSALSQHFPVIEEVADFGTQLFYPVTEELEEYFGTRDQALKFGEARFCGFLHDTIAVEHNVVIPAVSSASLLQCPLPKRALEDLYKLIGDEGHHAAQAVVYMHSVANRFRIKVCKAAGKPPKFLRRLGGIKFELSDPNDQILYDVLAGIVTETRISVELSEFATNSSLIESVRDICRSHQEDEAIHSSQFRSLERWVWEQLNEEKRSLAASMYARIIIARSLPDIDRLAFYLSDAAGIASQCAHTMIAKVYTPERLMQETLFAAKPTLRFLASLGVVELPSFKTAYASYDWEAAASNDAVI